MGAQSLRNFLVRFSFVSPYWNRWEILENSHWQSLLNLFRKCRTHKDMSVCSRIDKGIRSSQRQSIVNYRTGGEKRISS